MCAAYANRDVMAMVEASLKKTTHPAEYNRDFFEARNILAINLTGTPGSGKTTLLERTFCDLKGYLDFYALEADQKTTIDSGRIHATGTSVIQINTGKTPHLEAFMIANALQAMMPSENSTLFMENVGGLTNPANVDLGEKERVVVMSVTEGEEKPLKYPAIFRAATLCVINKTDLLPYVSFNLEKAKDNAKRVNPGLQVIALSCFDGEGLELWYDWLQSRLL